MKNRPLTKALFEKNGLKVKNKRGITRFFNSKSDVTSVETRGYIRPIIADRNLRASYNSICKYADKDFIIADRNLRASYNVISVPSTSGSIIADRNLRASYNCQAADRIKVKL